MTKKRTFMKLHFECQIYLTCKTLVSIILEFTQQKFTSSSRVWRYSQRNNTNSATYGRGTLLYCSANSIDFLTFNILETRSGMDQSTPISVSDKTYLHTWILCSCEKMVGESIRRNVHKNSSAKRHSLIYPMYVESLPRSRYTKWPSWTMNNLIIKVLI